MLRVILSLVVFIFGICLQFFPCHSQTTRPDVYQSIKERYMLSNPWAGGMNACQYGKLDIDMDGTMDLVVFDRTGDRIMPFIVSGPEVNPGYNFAPEYAHRFPPLSDWAIFKDYNGDGKADIFTYSPGFAGLKVFRNVSGTYLEFIAEVDPYLTSFQGGGYVNILVTYADYPAIVDLDGDSDLDILTFWGLGSFVEMHKNMSMEKYGHRDSLDYIKTITCWGYFAESEESNNITLDTCYGLVQSLEFEVQSSEERHTGSTFQVLDLNGDGLLDLLLGDVDYPNLIALYNGGNQDTARMVSYDWEFPPYSSPIKLFSMPAPFFEDIDQDGIRDLLASPFDPNPYICDNINSSWYYRNVGSDLAPYFTLVNQRFLQEGMIDVGAGAYPVFADYNRDGLPDLFVGNYGRYDTSYMDQNLILHSEHVGKIALYLNAGNVSQPAFTGIMDDFASVSQLDILGAVPAFADLDGDEDVDMLLGNDEGRLIYFENSAQAGQPMEMTLRDNQYQGIDVGQFSAPALFDVDQDGLTDLIIGEKGGNLNFYRNTGSSGNPVFELVTDSLGKINVTDPNVSLDGYSVPFLVNDSMGHIQLLVGSEQGKIFYYPNIEDDLNGTFKESGDLGTLVGLTEFSADRGFRSSGALADLNHDGIWELVAGNFSGGLEYFSGSGLPVVNGINDFPKLDQLILVYPNPAVDYLHVECTNTGLYHVNSISLYDISGREILIHTTRTKHINTLDVSNLSDGLYFIEVSLSENHHARSFSYLKKMLKKTKSR